MMKSTTTTVAPVPVAPVAPVPVAPPPFNQYEAFLNEYENDALYISLKNLLLSQDYNGLSEQIKKLPNSDDCEVDIDLCIKIETILEKLFKYIHREFPHLGTDEFLEYYRIFREVSEYKISNPFAENDLKDITMEFAKSQPKLSFETFESLFNFEDSYNDTLELCGLFMKDHEAYLEVPDFINGITKRVNCDMIVYSDERIIEFLRSDLKDYIQSEDFEEVRGVDEAFLKYIRGQIKTSP
jgi:hypothetical protein